jgi:hypothetical protein
MVDVSAIAGTVSALKGVIDISKVMIGLHDAQAIQAKVIELNSKILEAQTSAFAAQDERSTLIERISELEKELAKLKAWDTEKEKYELKNVGRGASTYVRKQDAQPSEEPHWLCANCYAKGKKSFLQYNRSQQRDHIYRCAACSAEIRVDYSVSPSGR